MYFIIHSHMYFLVNIVIHILLSGHTYFFPLSLWYVICVYRCVCTSVRACTGYVCACHCLYICNCVCVMCVFVYRCVYISVRACTGMRVHVTTCVIVCVCLCVCVCVLVCVRAQLWVCVRFGCITACVCVCTSVRACTVMGVRAVVV
jgi:hypothetical protein